MRLSFHFIARCLVLAVLICSAAEAADDAPGTWLVVSTSDYFRPDGTEPRWRYSFDAQYRWFDRGEGIHQALVRPALGYNISPRLSAWAGYAYLRLKSEPDIEVAEHRLWQQLAWQDKGILNSTWLWRGRLEERHRESADNTRLSLRLMVQATTPLKTARDIKLVTSVESFFDLRETSWNADSGFAQLRSIVSLQFDVSPAAGLQVGYMNQYIHRDNRPNVVDHMLYLNLRLRL